MTKDIELKKHADRLTTIAAQLVSLCKDFDREYKALCKDSATKWPDKKSKLDYVLEELLAPVNDVIIANAENAHSLLSDAQEILRIESGYQSEGNPVEDLYEETEKARDCAAKKQAEIDQRRQVGLEFAARKKQIVPSFDDLRPASRCGIYESKPSDPEPEPEPDTKNNIMDTTLTHYTERLTAVLEQVKSAKTELAAINDELRGNWFYTQPKLLDAIPFSQSASRGLLSAQIDLINTVNQLRRANGEEPIDTSIE